MRLELRGANILKLQGVLLVWRIAKTLLFPLALIFSVGAASADAQPPQYFGIFGSDARIQPNEGGRGDTSNLNLKLGYGFNDFLGMEFHLGRDFKRDRADTEDGVQYFAALVRGNLPFERINVYGLLGIASVNADFANIDGSYTNGSVGVGVELYGNQRTAIGLEWMQYGFDDRYRTAGIGLVHHFDWPHFSSRP